MKNNNTFQWIFIAILLLLVAFVGWDCKQRNKDNSATEIIESESAAPETTVLYDFPASDMATGDMSMGFACEGETILSISSDGDLTYKGEFLLNDPILWEIIKFQYHFN